MNGQNCLAAVGVIAWSQWREQWRSRSFLIAVFFSGVLLYASFLLGALAADQELRTLLDFGQSFIELMGLGLAVFGAATGVLREMEQKTLYLILTRPVPRWAYLLGRYFGLLMTTFGAVAFMTAVHLSVLAWKGWAFEPAYLLGVFGILLKLAVACALATFLALFTTSVLSALTVTGILWTLGHFIPEMTFLAKKSRSLYGMSPMLAVTYLVPNLGLFNFRDRLSVPSFVLPSEPVAAAALYAAAYSSACLLLGYAFFRRKEF